MSNVCICNKIFKILCEMKTVQLQKHLSFNFSAHLILAQVCIQNHPAGDVTIVSVVPVKMTVKIGDSRDLKKYYGYRYGCPIKDVKKRITMWWGCRLFYLLFVLFIAVEIDSKLTLHHMGKVILFKLPTRS